MPVPPSVPVRRAQAARRPPVRARPRSSSSSAGRWIALLGLLTVATSVAVGTWFTNRRRADPAPTPEAPSQEALPAAVAELTPSLASPESVPRAMAEAPLLTSESALALLTEMARRGQHLGHALDGALFVASAGFADLDRATLGALGEGFAKSWSGRSASERDRIQAYMRHARHGEPLSPNDIDEGRALFTQGVRALPAASQERLRALFAKAVAAGIAHQQQAEERARLAALTPLPPAETPSPALREVPTRFAEARPNTSPGPGPGIGSETASSGPSAWDQLQAKIQQWRQRYRPAKADVDRLQKEVAKLEEDAKNNFVAGPVSTSEAVRRATGITHKTPIQNSPYTTYAEQIQVRLPAARRELDMARQVLASIEEAARKDGVASGQLY